MANLPSIKTLSAAFPELSREHVAALRAIMRGTAPKICKGCGKDLPSDDAERTDQICSYFHDGNCRYSRMAQLDKVLGGFGVEYIARGTNAKSPAICYVNMGDPYLTTILKINGRFRVGCWGDIVERGNYA